MKSQFVVMHPSQNIAFPESMEITGKVTFASGKSPFGLNSSFDDKAQCPYRLPR